MEKLTLVLASRNKHKIQEISDMLSEYLDGVTLLSLDDVGIPDDIEENGSTFAENALIKARVAQDTGYIAFADDSGLIVPSLGGEPGIRSARYAGGHGDDQANRDLLLKNLDGSTDRAAYFVCCIACVLPNGETFTVEGRVDGEILRTEVGSGGFGYDNLFFYKKLDRSFAELSAKEKNAVSHRRNAIKAFAESLSDRLSIPLKSQTKGAKL